MCSATCPPVLDSVAANPDVTDDEAEARRNLVLETQHLARRSANDRPVVPGGCAVRFGEAAVVPVHDVQADRFPEGHVQTFPDQHVHVERHSRVNGCRLSGETGPCLEVVVEGRRTVAGSLRQAERGIERVDVLDVVNDAVDGVPAIELVVCTSRPLEVGLNHRRVNERLIQTDDDGRVDVPQLVVVLRRLGDERELRDLAGAIAFHVPLEVLVLRASSGHVRVRGGVRGRLVIAIARQEDVSREANPGQPLLGDEVHVGVRRVVEGAAVVAGVQIDQSAGDVVAPVRIERTRGRVPQGRRCIEHRQ